MTAPPPSCGSCARAHLEHQRKLVGRQVQVVAVLQCRALPPRPDDLVQQSHFPAVGPHDYCHLYFEPGEPRAAAAEATE